MKKIIALLLVAMLTVSLLAGCAKEEATEEVAVAETAEEVVEETEIAEEVEEIAKKTKIAAFLPLTGEMMQYGEAIVNGANYALEDFNAEYGTNYTFEVYDDKGDATEAVNIANKIITDDEVICAYGSFSSTCSLAAVSVFQEANMLQISPTASHTDFLAAGDTTLAFVCTNATEVKEHLNVISEIMDTPDLAIIYQNTDHGVLTEETVLEVYPEMGGTVVASETFISGSSKDFTPILSKIKETNPEVVYINATYAEGAQIILQAKSLGMDECSFFGMGMFYTPEMIDLLGDDADNVYALVLGESLLVDPENDPEYADTVVSEETMLFARRYLEDYGTYPNGFAGVGYDSMYCMLTKFYETDAQDAVSLANAIKEIDGYAGVCGILSFTEDGSMVKEGYAMSIEDGKFVIVE